MSAREPVLPTRLAPQRMAIHLLIVDDDDVDRERVLRLLTRSKWDVHALEAATGADALRMVREHSFDCVMLDNQLGSSNGAELIPALHREALHDCPIIMVTGAGNEALAVQALRGGASDYLSKYQLSTEVLTGAIERALDKQQLELEIDASQLRLQQRVDVQAVQIMQRERDLREILNHTSSAIGYWDATLHNRFGNKAHRSWLGVSSKGLPGRRLRDVIGASQFDRNRPRIEGVLKGRAQTFEQELVSKGNRTRHAQFSLRPDVDEEGVVRGFYSTVTDITTVRQAQSRAEELARFADAVIQNDSVGCGVFRSDGSCVMSNGSLESALGADAPRLQASGLWDWLAQRAPALASSCRDTMDDGSPRRADLDLHDTNTTVRLECRLARIMHDGRPHLLLFANDVTEQRRALDALVSARDSAEVAGRAKSAFLANMSHEIRTPMNAIIGLSRLALEDALPPGARDDLDKIHNASVALMGLLDDVLDYSKMEAGELHFEQAGFDLEQVLQRTIDIFAVRIGQKGLDFVVDLPPTLPTRVTGDALRLSQVLNNLVGNAVKFTESGHVHVIVQELGHADPRRCLLKFSVRDSGIGIAPSQHAGLFDAFTQADSSITRRFGGTGLGLTICQRLVGMMGGQIGINSVPERGSEFWFTVDLLRDDASLPADLHSSGVELLRVLIVDDASEAGRVLRGRLHAWNVRVESASDAQAALQLALQGRLAGDPFDVVLLDARMFSADAQQALMHSLRQVPGGGAGSPFIVLATSAARQRASADSDVSLADAVLVKPILPSPLLAVLRDALARRGSHGASADAVPMVAPARLPTRAEALRVRSAPLTGARVLVAEDNMVNQIVARRVLSGMGLDVVVVNDGAQALAMLEHTTEQQFDAVLMDLHMPVMGGVEATRRIHACPGYADVPVIAMTAAALPEDRALCFNAGMVDYVAKPLVPESLLDTLLKWIPPDAQGRLAALRADREPLPDTSDTSDTRPDSGVAGLDLDALRKRVLGDEALAWQLLAKFVALEHDTGTRLASMLSNADHEGLRYCAQMLSGASQSLDLTVVAAASAGLEAALRDKQPVEAPTRHLIGVLETALRELRLMIGRRDR